MSQFESLIDGTGFGIIRDYLDSPGTPIGAILHVKDRAMLAPLAREIEQHILDGKGLELAQSLARKVEEGSLKISMRKDISIPGVQQGVDASSIPRSAMCYVIYQPPFYLSHTPGLFEGKFDRSEARARTSSDNRAGPERDVPKRELSRETPSRDRSR